MVYIKDFSLQSRGRPYGWKPWRCCLSLSEHYNTGVCNPRWSVIGWIVFSLSFSNCVPPLKNFTWTFQLVFPSEIYSLLVAFFFIWIDYFGLEKNIEFIFLPFLSLKFNLYFLTVIFLIKIILKLNSFYYFIPLFFSF